MKKLFVFSLISCCSILFSYLQADEKNEVKRKTVVIHYNPDDTEITKVIPVESVQYTTIKHFCKQMLSEKGTMAYLPSRHSVIVYDKRANTEKIAAFIKKIDAPAVNIRVDVDFLENGNSRDDRLNVTFGNSEYPHHKNQIIFKDGKMVPIDEVAVSGHKRSGTSTRNTSQFIMTRSGHPARIWVGTTIVDPQWMRWASRQYTFIYPTPGGGMVVVQQPDLENMVWRDIGSSLYVLPTYLGNGKIKLELYPAVSFLVDDPSDRSHHKKKRKTVMVQDVKTSIIVSNGQRVYIGGAINSKKNFYRSLFGPELFRRTGKGSVLDMYVRATVIPPGSSGRRSFIPRTPDVIPRQ